MREACAKQQQGTAGQILSDLIIAWHCLFLRSKMIPEHGGTMAETEDTGLVTIWELLDHAVSGLMPYTAYQPTLRRPQ